MIRNIEKYRPEGASFGTWLISIAKNCYTDHLHKDGIKLEELSEAELFDGLEDPAGQAVEKNDLRGGAKIAFAPVARTGIGHPAEI